MGKFKKMKKVLICLFSFLFIASATVAGGVLLSGSSYSVPVSESAGEEIQDNENLTNDNNNATSNATEPLNDGNWTGSGNYDTTFAGGTGTESDPYLVSTARQLAGLAYWTNISTSTTYNSSSVYYRQTADIDLSAYWWDAIGTSTSSTYYFQGHYDGDGHTVSGVFTSASGSYQGLFGYVRGASSTNRAEISNVGVINSNIQGYQYVAGIAGRAQYTNITNCYNTGSVTGSDRYVGGVVGYNRNSSTVSNSYNTGNVTSTYTGTEVYLGGVVGYNIYSSTVSNSYNTGSVTGSSQYVGGVVGRNYSSSTVSNSYNTGTVTGSSSYVGGVVGNKNSSSTVSNCYYGGNCASSIGGINGADVDGQAKYLGTITTDAKTESWYGSSSTVTWNSSYPWDFTDTWGITQYANDGYPYLLGVGNIAPDNTDYLWTDSAVTTRDIDFEGSGTASDPYLISSAEELAGLAYNVNNGTNYSGTYFKQTADIDVSAYWWDAIGTPSNYFQGHYDGGNFTVLGIYTPAGSTDDFSFQGLFGYVSGTSSNYAKIKNVGIANSNIQGYNSVGGVVGYTKYTIIDNCKNYATIVNSGKDMGGIAGYLDYSSKILNSYNYGNINGESFNIGGIAGYSGSSSYVSNSVNNGTIFGNNDSVGGVVGANDSSTVSNSYNTGSVTGSNWYVGGVVGYNYSATVTNSYNTGSVTASSQRVGGVVGWNRSSTVSNSYNTGDVTSSSSYVGGVVGYNYDGADVYNSFNTGSVAGTGSYVGAIVGRNYFSSPTVYNCYWGVNCTQTSAYGSNSGTVANCSRFENDSDPKTYVFFQDSTNWYSSYPWDFENVWTFDGSNEGYPVLREMKTLKINLITAGRVTPSIDITTSGGTLDSNNILSTTTSENVIAINFENTSSSTNVYIAFNEEPTSESALNSATYEWDLTNGEVLNVYVYQRRVVTYHSSDNQSVSYEYIGSKSITTISNPFEVEEGYHFTYWNTNSAGTGTGYAQSTNITSSFNYDLDLYAQYSGTVYNVVFNHGNGTSTTYYLKYGTGLYGTNPGDNSASAPLENIAPITRDGYTFHGYYTGENGTGEQIIDENGNVVGSPTFTLSPTTIYAYWTVNVPAYYDEAGGYWYIEYGKMPQTKLDSTVEADRIVINALDGDNVLDDTDGVTASSNIYYFAGNMLTSKIYNGEEYSYFLGNWYKVEPIKWVLNTEASSSQSGYISTDTLAVMESVVYVGKYSTSSIGLNNGYSNSVFVEDFYNNFNINERNYLNQFTVSAEQFTSQGTTSSTISDSYIYLSSQEEIATICGGTATEFSDLVLDYLSIFGEGNYYFVRDLGSNLNSVTCYTQGGGELNQAPTSTLGMRFTIQVNEFICLE